jgi:hypothetical protein
MKYFDNLKNRFGFFIARSLISAGYTDEKYKRQMALFPSEGYEWCQIFARLTFILVTKKQRRGHIKDRFAK